MQKGFTLVELAISVTIIGILLAGVLGGVSLQKEAQLRKVVTELGNFKQAIDAFEKQYQYLPGDFPNASNFWSGAHNGDGDTGIKADGAIGVREDLFAWEHMGKAGVIQGSFTGVPNPSATGNTGYVAGESAYGSQGIDGAVYGIVTHGYSTAGSIFGTRGHVIRMGAPSGASNTPYATANIIAKDAYSIDKKIDDGTASLGMFYSVNAAGASSGCVNAAETAASASYTLSDTTKTCQLIYWYKKF